MNDYQTVTCELFEDVALVRLNRPNQLNAFDQQLCRDVGSALQAVAQDQAVRVVVLGGHGRVFSAGADLKSGLPDGASVTKRLKEEYKPGLLAIAGMEKPVISVIQGSAAGIGLAYALTADLVMMADGAFMLSPFANIGLIPDGGLNWMLPTAIGYHRAFQMAVECERLPSSRCLELGLVNRVVPEDQLLGEAMTWAKSLAARAPKALSLTKRAMRQASEVNFSAMIDWEAETQATCIESHDCREGVAAFLEKRKPHFRGT